MKLILVGCEYSGTTTLAHAIDDWAEDNLGSRFSLIHDHFKIPHTIGHPSDLSPEEHARRALAAGTDPLQVSLKAAQLSNAAADLKKADKDLADLQLGPDPLELAVRKRQESLARATCAESAEDLLELTRT